MDYDVIIIGGSYAGMSAGLQLARARRKVLVIDAGQRRNRYAAHSHGFLTQDGRPPEEIAAAGRAQLIRYATVQWLDDWVEVAEPIDGGFRIVARQGSAHTAQRLILAAGVQDELPELPGLAQRWGRHVFHCPYCHGYELEQGNIGVLAVSAISLHQGLMLPDWGATTLFLNDAFEPDAEQSAHLTARNVQVERGRVARLDGEAVDVVMQDGRVFSLAGLFVATRVRPGALAAQLGCELEEGPLGPYVKADFTRATTIPGVFACGDLARPAGSVALAVGDGAMAGAAAHRSLMFGL
ncbi:NAD(P)/FAD-dependent oxidoreductase [Bordetella genomosp. 4]|uniref:NAD(P)/FAD-dependent oxidoreductase n=1 Tax=Bordetella genomosp. 4 TaxID=463044 RepID=UPI000B9EE174|nr:NAD(P)/FAD-dependent oxidoreductase [Bordetella genomosp. 4]OZI51492.1 thioredoxin reductase [Bordetella genomosp. 4]